MLLPRAKPFEMLSLPLRQRYGPSSLQRSLQTKTFCSLPQYLMLDATASHIGVSTSARLAGLECARAVRVQVHDRVLHPARWQHLVELLQFMAAGPMHVGSSATFICFAAPKLPARARPVMRSTPLGAGSGSKSPWPT